MIGNGNVAIDVARMLVLDPSELSPTDTADHAIEAFAGAGVEEVVMLGRRGPAQASFTNPELRELGELVRADVHVDPADLELDDHSQAWLESEADPTTKRNVEILRDYSQREPSGRRHRISMRFLYSPIEVLGEGEHGPVTGIRVVRNRLEVGDDGRVRAVSTGSARRRSSAGWCCDRSATAAGRSATSRSTSAAVWSATTAGACSTRTGRPLPGEYVVGWIKRGPTGVIGTNKKDAADTVAKIVEDAEAHLLDDPRDDDRGVDRGVGVRAGARRRHVERVAGDRRARTRARRAPRQAPRQARSARRTARCGAQRFALAAADDSAGERPGALTDLIVR